MAVDGKAVWLGPDIIEEFLKLGYAGDIKDFAKGAVRDEITRRMQQKVTP